MGEKKKESPRVNMMNDRALAPNIILRKCRQERCVSPRGVKSRDSRVYVYKYRADGSVRGSGVANKSPGLYSARIKSVDKTPPAKSDRGKSAKSGLARYARLRVCRALIEDSHVILLRAHLRGVQVRLH